MTAPAPEPDIEKLLADADQAASKNEWERAISILDGAPDLVRVLDKRAFYLSRAKRYDEACNTLAVLREREPANFLWQHMTGYQYYVQERYVEAVPWFVEAFRLNRTHIRNLYRLAQSRRHQGELVRAQRAAAEVRRLGSRSLSRRANVRRRPSPRRRICWASCLPTVTREPRSSRCNRRPSTTPATTTSTIS